MYLKEVKGRRNIGRPRKRGRDQLHLEDQGTGNMPNLQEHDDDDDDDDDLKEVGWGRGLVGSD